MPELTPIQAQWLTFGFVLAVTVLVIGYDLLVIQTYGVNASISRVLRKAFSLSPTLFVAFCVWIGILIGHIGMSCE